MRTIVVVSAGLSTPSTTKTLADELANAAASAIAARGEAHQIVHIELRTLATDLATALTTGGNRTPVLQDAHEAVASADGLIVVTPVFQASYSGLFKMFFDTVEQDTLTTKPTLLAATAGTARHSLVLDFAMRPLFSYLKAAMVPTAVFAAVEDFGGAHGSDLSKRIQRATTELAQMMLVDATTVGGLGGPFAAGAKTVRDTGLQQSDGELSTFERILSNHLE
ncbi:NAD(P)H-dependent oxidoreductase [Staphylococcus chromogenes]|nr:NAD(P)H-dependent oxidoreductase [Staphylococcus chromogenes]